MTLFKNCSQNFDLSINMALVNGGFLYYMDMKKFLKNFFLQNRLSDFEIISQECSLGDPFKKFSQNFDLALVNGGFLHYTIMKKFFKKSCSQKPLVRFRVQRIHSSARIYEYNMGKDE